MIGRRFGHLTVVKQVQSQKRGKVRAAQYECLCSCGKKKTVTASHLRSGNTISCGCQMGVKQRRKGTAMRALMRKYKYMAERRELVWALNEQQFEKLTSSPCFYTGRLPAQKIKVNSDVYTYNGVDRVDSSAGYIISNVVPCCKDANLAKNALSQKEFYKLCREVVQLH